MKNKKKARGLVGVHITPGGVAVAHCLPTGSERQQLRGCEFIAAKSAAEQSKALQRAVDEMGLRGQDANVVLTPGSYSLVMLEAPQVADEELKQAVRWRIKDMIGFDVAEAAIDIIPLPEDNVRVRTKMIYAVAAHQPKIDQIEQLTESAGLTLKYIDIPELAVCNLMGDIDYGEMGFGVIYLGEGDGLINLIKNHNLYLSRKLKANTADLVGPESGASNAFNHLLLETQRSLDYYVSQLGQASATQLWLAPLAEGRMHLAEDFSNNLGIQTQVMKLDPIVEGAESMSYELQEQCAMAIGGALRKQ